MADPSNNNDRNPFNTQAANWGCSWYQWVVVVILLFLGGQFLIQNYTGQPKEISWTEFQNNQLADQEVEKIRVVNRQQAEVFIKEEKLGQGRHESIEKDQPGPHYVFNLGSIEQFEQVVNEAQEDVPTEERMEIEYVQRTDWFGNILAWVLPFAILLFIWFFILNRMRGGGGMTQGGRNIMDFGKATPEAFKKKKPQVTFRDVAGLEEVKVEVKEIVDFLKNPERYTRLGAKIPKGVILVGPPGTGKTLLARAVAGEADVPFFSMSGSEFVEMFVGVGASRVRDLFKKAKQNSPSIIFIDEIDAIGRTRGKAISMQTNDERENTLNQLLAEMDGFEANTGVIVMAATNRAEILDRALLRPGRFDRQIYLNLPTQIERKAIFEVHTQPLILGSDINLDILSSQTPGFSGADIANICNEAALIAARRDKDTVDMKDFYDATDRVIAGLERKAQIISPEERKIIAYHEAGHATTSWYLPKADNLLKVSIIPRGKSLGSAWYLPEEHHVFTRSELIDKMVVALGGRAAEDVVFGEISSNALDDLERVTKQAYMMVAYYGLDEEIGNLSYFDSTGEYQQSLHRPYSEATAERIDKEVSRIVENSYDKAREILKEYREKLDQLAHLLLEKEVVYQADLEKVFGKRLGQQTKS